MKGTLQTLMSCIEQSVIGDELLCATYIIGRDNHSAASNIGFTLTLS